MTNVTFYTFPDATFKRCSVNQVLSSQNSSTGKWERIVDLKIPPLGMIEQILKAKKKSFEAKATRNNILRLHFLPFVRFCNI